MNNEARVLLAPGASVLLGRVAQQLGTRPDVSMMNTANALLWHLRRSTAPYVLAATELDDFDAGKLIEIIHALRPQTHLVLCGPPSAELSGVASPNVEFVSSVQSLTQCLQRLGLDAPPSLPSAPPASEPFGPSAWSAALVAQGHQVIDGGEVANIQGALQRLSDDVGASAVVLSDYAGMTVMEVGQVPHDVEPLYAPMLATVFSTASEFGRLLGDTHAGRLYVQSGAKHHLYALAVGERWVLSAICPANAGQRSRQPVLQMMRRAAQELRESRTM